MRTFQPPQRSTLLKFYFAACYLVLIEELIRASMSWALAAAAGPPHTDGL